MRIGNIVLVPGDKPGRFTFAFNTDGDSGGDNVILS